MVLWPFTDLRRTIVRSSAQHVTGCSREAGSIDDESERESRAQGNGQPQRSSQQIDVPHQCLQCDRLLTKNHTAQKTLAKVEKHKTVLVKKLQEATSELRDRTTELTGATTKLRDERAAVEKAKQNCARLEQERDEERRRSNVLLNCERQLRADAEAARDRLETTLAEHTASRLLAQGINIQGTCTTLPEIGAHIKRTLTVKASEWMEDAEAAGGLTAVLQHQEHRQRVLQLIMIRLFFVARELIGFYDKQYASFFRGGEGSGDDGAEMDSTTADFMRQYLRKHHTTLFPISGDALNKATQDIVNHVGGEVELWARENNDPGVIIRSLVAGGFERLVSEFLKIFVDCVLQHPPVTFTEDCGKIQPFDSKLHSEPIDGDAVTEHCLVIFPAMVVKTGIEQPPQVVNKRFTLAIHES